MFLKISKSMMMVLVSISLIQTSCAINVRIIKDATEVPKETIEVLQKSQNLPAVLTIGGTAYPCVIVSADEDNITVSSYETVSEIPVKAVSSVLIDNSKPGKGVLYSGLVIGGLTGGLISEAAVNKTELKSNDKKTALQIGSVAAGSLLGMLAVKQLGMNNSGDMVVINEKVKPFLLHKKVGKAIKHSDIAAYHLFDDVNLNAGEVLLVARIFEYDTAQFLIVYETHDGVKNRIHWEAVDSDYIKAQKDKIKLPIKDNDIVKTININ